MPCPTCQQPLRVPTGAAAEAGAAPDPLDTASKEVCAICQSPIAGGEARSACPACSAEYHAECWQENKPCPACGREILAAAVRCRHCGATFSSARPEDAGEFWARSERDERLPQVRRTVIWLFICCIVPCVAPIGLVWGGIWYARNRDDVGALPSLYGALCKIGLGVAVALVVGIALMALVHAVLTGI